MDKEIIDNNILIFDFMGCQHSKDFTIDLWEMGKLGYHYSWNELMPVVEKLGVTTVKSTATYNPDYQIRIEIVNGYTKIEGLGKRIFYNSSVCGSMLLATYGAVVEAIERVNYLTEKYNSKTQTNG